MKATEVQDHGLQHLVWPGYTIALIMLVMPLVDAVTAIGTFSPTLYRWRFGAMGILSTNIVTPLFGLLVALTIASLRQHRWVLRSISVLALFAGMVLLAMMIMFLLDGLQMRAELAQEVRGGFLVVSAKALLAQVLATVGLGTVGFAGLRALRGMRPRGRAARGSAADLVVAAPPR